ncbi:MAG TPA: UDP-N-acetylglucosamine 2-epimerase (non-hydrolyzing) [Pseudonocardiaceae bacterium]
MGEVLLLVGTRPEAVKVAPVALALAEQPALRPVIVHSGQHPAMVHQALRPFGLRPDLEIAVDRRTGTQAELMAAVLPALDELIVRRRPAAVLVQGDTNTTLAGALAAFWRQVPVAHLEAGLRSGDLAAPFPEEGGRQMVSRIASLHLAPTRSAALALRSESVLSGRIVVTGNTVVDAVQHIARAGLPAENAAVAAAEHQVEAFGARLMLVTAHRRESWGEPLDRVLHAVRAIVDHHENLIVLVPTHPNPAVGAQVRAVLGDHPRVAVTAPLEYPDLVRVLRIADVVLTDSGGIQEEAPSFGTPVLVLREVTERREAVEAGCAWLVGTDPAYIATEADRVLRSGRRVESARNPYGDGRAGGRVANELLRMLTPGRHRALIAS